MYNDDGGLTFNLDQTGAVLQVQYKSTSMGGTGHVGKIKFKGFSFDI